MEEGGFVISRCKSTRYEKVQENKSTESCTFIYNINYKKLK